MTYKMMNSLKIAEYNDHRVMCDKTGLPVLASECDYQWNGMFMRKDYIAPRQPQDEISSLRDDSIELRGNIKWFDYFS